MLKKVSIILAIVAAFGLVFTAPAPADAKSKKKAVVVVGPKKKGVVVVGPKNKGVVVHKKGGPTYVVGKTYNGYVYVGKKRRNWHGKWYAYGIGPCWIRVGDVWLWNVVACP